MPAEIDTGGPRVLHCDYRADCPIPIVVSASSAESSLPREDRFVPLPRSSIVRRLPRIDENEPSVEAALRFSPSSRRRGVARGSHGPRAVRRAEACTAFNVPNDGDVARDAGDIAGRDSLEDAVPRPEDRLEARLRDVADEFEARPTIEEKRSRVPVYESITAGNQRLERRRKASGRQDRSEWISRSEFPGGDFLETAEAARLRRPFFSSHRSRTEDREPEPCSATGAWQDPPSGTDWGSSGTRKSRRSGCPKSCSYFHLAFLLFLVAFGQTGLLKSSVLNFSARPSTAGLSVLTIGTVIGAVSAAPVDLMGDAGVRTERSANLSHITGASRKIQMYIKNRHLQILPDGTVNGSNDDTSDYTIFQRTSVSRGQLRIQGVATCLYLCMDSCGLLYGSREYTEDCVFNETLEQHNYNTYSSVRWSTAKKTLYLGLNRRGQPRRVQAKGHNLGRLSAYARVLTQVAPPDRVETLQRRMLGAQHNVRHRHNGHGQHHRRGDAVQQSLCPKLPPQEKDGRDRFRCRKRKKRKKRKRRKPGEKPDNPKRDIH